MSDDEAEILTAIRVSLGKIETRMENCVSAAEFMAFKSTVKTYGACATLILGVLMWYFK